MANKLFSVVVIGVCGLMLMFSACKPKPKTLPKGLKVISNTQNPKWKFTDFQYVDITSQNGVQGFLLNLNMDIREGEKYHLHIQPFYHEHPILGMQQDTVSFDLFGDDSDEENSLFVPFYLLHSLSATTADTEWRLDGFAVTEKDDSTEVKKLMATAWLSLRVQVPEIKQMKIEVLSYYTDTSAYNPHEMDVSFLGPGYPDLFWKIFLGGNSIYTSSINHNALAVETGELATFYATLKDTLKIGVYDSDDLSKDDFMGKTNVTLTQLSETQTHALKFDKIKKLNYKLYEAKPPKEVKPTAAPATTSKKKKGAK